MTALFRSFAALSLLLWPLGGPAATPGAPVYGYRVIHAYPHDRGAFTQGLVYFDGFLYEGTGLRGQSSIRKVKLETGEVIQQRAIPAQYFGEGIAVWGARLIELTWQSGTGFVFSRSTLQPLSSFSYPGEGWGLAADGRRLIMSDGTSTLRFWDPETLRETGRLPVTDNGSAVDYLNELEFVRGEIYANVWQTDRIARISPSTGHVTGWVDLSGILPAADRSITTDVLNGIAYDAQRDRLFVTGKLWPKLFEIKVVAKR